MMVGIYMDDPNYRIVNQFGFTPNGKLNELPYNTYKKMLDYIKYLTGIIQC